MAAITANGLTFAYDGSYDNVFENVNFSIDTRWKLGLIGRNGCGKTTLLKLIMGELDSNGALSVPCGCDYFPFPVKDESVTAMEAALSVDPELAEWQIEAETAMLDLDSEVLGREYRTLSNGERTKLMLGALFARENRFLLIDEPTNHLDAEGRQIVSEYLGMKSGFILVCHDRDFLDGCVDHILSINKTTIEVQKGNYSSWKENRDRTDQYELAKNDRLKKEIGRLSAAAGRTAQWSDKIEKEKYGTGAGDRGYLGHKSAKMMARSKAIEKRRSDAVAEKESLLKDIEETEPLILRPEKHHSPNLALISSLSTGYGERTVIRDLDLILKNGERLAITGRNGTGKSTLIKLLAGVGGDYTGSLTMPPTLKISYVPQDASNLRGGLMQFAAERQINESLFLTILRKFGFKRVQFEKDMRDFSAGQRKKVLLAASFCTTANLYLWDEPLNYIDLSSRTQIEDAILVSEPTMVFIEHDRAFTRRIATRIIEL